MAYGSDSQNSVLTTLTCLQKKTFDEFSCMITLHIIHLCEYSYVYGRSYLIIDFQKYCHNFLAIKLSICSKKRIMEIVAWSFNVILNLR